MMQFFFFFFLRIKDKINAMTIYLKIKRRRRTDRYENLPSLNIPNYYQMYIFGMCLTFGKSKLPSLSMRFLSSIETDFKSSCRRFLRYSMPLGTVFNSVQLSISRDFRFGITPFSIIISFIGGKLRIPNLVSLRKPVLNIVVVQHRH